MIIKLRKRMVVAIMLISSVLMLTSFAAIYIITFLRIQAEEYEKLHRKERITASASVSELTYNDFDFREPVILNKFTDSQGYFNILADETGKYFMVDSAFSSEEIAESIYQEAVDICLQGDSPSIVVLEGKKWRYMHEPAHLSGGEVLDSTGEIYAIRFVDVSDSQSYLHFLRLTLIMIAIVLFVAIYLLSRHFADRAVRPLLISWEKQRQFIADASHELKTPLSIINANIDMLCSNPQATIESQRKWIDYISAGTKRMTNLVSSLLTLAKTEDVQSHLELTVFTVDELTAKSFELMRPLFERKNITLCCAILSRANIKSNPDMLAQVLEILLDNALKYTNEGGTVAVCTSTDKGHVLITVSNSAGIAAKDPSSVFDRFYRGDFARTADSDSYGLGLSIAQSHINRLGGEIYVESEYGKTVFTVKLKLNL